MPTNTRVLILFPGPEATIYSTPLRITATAAKVQFADMSVALRTAAKVLVPSATVTVAGTTLPTLELRPKVPLAALTKYQVVIQAKNRDFIVSEFTTGREPSESPPPREEIERVRYYAKYPCVAQRCNPFADLRLRGASVKSDMLYEVHLLDKAGEVQKDTLRTIVRASPSTPRSIHIGSGANGCWPLPDFNFPATGTLRLGIRAVDLAGNQGPLLRVELDLDHPSSQLD